MSCLFGYCGTSLPGLLDKMETFLEHRCPSGTQRVRVDRTDGKTTEISHGIPAWSRSVRVAAHPETHTAIGYSGVLFKAGDLLKEASGPDPDFFQKRNFHTADQLTALEGAFTLALERQNELLLLRDPAGIKVIYWARTPQRLLFASEIKALFADPLLEKRLRTEALPEYLTFSFIPGEKTMFEGVFELQPGTLLRYKDEKVTCRRYFKFEAIEPNGNRPEAYIRRIREDLEASVAECCALQADPPGVFLSGGIDSSSVLAVTATQFSHRPLKTFSVHFGKPYADENPFIEMMTGLYRTDHTFLEIRPKNFLKKMRHIIWCLDDPIGDPVTVPNFLLSEAASRSCRIILNGEGGDPCFGGPKNLPMMLAHLYGRMSGPDPLWLEKEYLASYRKCFSDLSRILHPDVWAASEKEDALARIISPFLNTDHPKSFLNKMMSMNIRLKGANLILVKVDKMSSANGILALPPLFSGRIIRSAMACPPASKLTGSIEKAVLKAAVADIVPSAIMDRPKSGMMVPVRFWLQQEMRRHAKHVLSPGRLKQVGLFNAPYVKKLLAYDRNEVQGARYGQKLWMLLTFMLWHEQMIEEKR